MSSPNNINGKRKERKNSWKRIIYCDPSPSYPQTTMQGFVINWARMRQQYTTTFKEDSPTEQFMRRITVTGGSFSNTRQYSVRQSLPSRDIKTTRLQPPPAMQYRSKSSAMSIYTGRGTPPEESYGNLTFIVELNMCIYNGEIRRSLLD